MQIGEAEELSDRELEAVAGGGTINGSWREYLGSRGANSSAIVPVGSSELPTFETSHGEPLTADCMGTGPLRREPSAFSYFG